MLTFINFSPKTNIHISQLFLIWLRLNSRLILGIDIETEGQMMSLFLKFILKTVPILRPEVLALPTLHSVFGFLAPPKNHAVLHYTLHTQSHCRMLLHTLAVEKSSWCCIHCSPVLIYLFIYSFFSSTGLFVFPNDQWNVWLLGYNVLHS